jgi:hypothetical protein
MTLVNTCHCNLPKWGLWSQAQATLTKRMLYIIQHLKNGSVPLYSIRHFSRYPAQGLAPTPPEMLSSWQGTISNVGHCGEFPVVSRQCAPEQGLDSPPDSYQLLLPTLPPSPHFPPESPRYLLPHTALCKDRTAHCPFLSRCALVVLCGQRK